MREQNTAALSQKSIGKSFLFLSYTRCIVLMHIPNQLARQTLVYSIMLASLLSKGSRQPKHGIGEHWCFHLPQVPKNERVGETQKTTWTKRDSEMARHRISKARQARRSEIRVRRQRKKKRICACS